MPLIRRATKLMSCSPMRSLLVQPLSPNSPWLAQIAAEQFAYWGPLTGYGSRNLYASFLEQAARGEALPRVLIATVSGTLMGSVNLLTNDMTIRPQFTPWMGQLFVLDNQRSLGIGTALIDAAASYVQQLGYCQLFLFTSGTLPQFYRNRGWIDVENVAYLASSGPSCDSKSMCRDRLRSARLASPTSRTMSAFSRYRAPTCRRHRDFDEGQTSH
jgi:GNAT superfamily N-acetyltransferase